MTIKMKDVFVLGEGHYALVINSSLIKSEHNDGITPYDMSNEAINAYDANQERIAELISGLERQRQGLVNLIDLELIPASHVDAATIEILAIDELLGE